MPHWNETGSARRSKSDSAPFQAWPIVEVLRLQRRVLANDESAVKDVDSAEIFSGASGSSCKERTCPGLFEILFGIKVQLN
jgi:hypothetical protein